MPPRTAPLENLLEAVPGCLVGVDREGVIRYVNRHAELLFGYDQEDLVGRPIETLVPESVRPGHPAHREAYFAGPGTRRPEPGRGGVSDPKPVPPPRCLRGRRRNGTEFPLNLSLSRLETEDGLLVLAAVRDLTERERAHEKDDMVSRLAAVVEQSDDAIIGKTLDGVVTTWNPAAERLFGYSSQEMLGQSIALLIPEGRSAEMTAILARIRAGEHVDHFETTRVRKDGTVLSVSLSVSPLRDADGAIIGASTIGRDVTAQRKAFEAARSMIESSLDSLVSISPEGMITDANAATVTLTGVPRADLIGTSFSVYFTDPTKAEKIYQLVFSEGMAVDYPLTIRHRDGTLTEVGYNASVQRDTDGNVLGVFAAARDMTRLLQAQREVAEEQSSALERLAELERFQRMTVGRELRMIELKKENESLRRLLQTDEGR
jgi:PAS domain S-box-containing protein